MQTQFKAGHRFPKWRTEPVPYPSIRSIITHIAMDIIWHCLCTIARGSRSNTWLIALWQSKKRGSAMER